MKGIRKLHSVFVQIIQPLLYCSLFILSCESPSIQHYFLYQPDYSQPAFLLFFFLFFILFPKFFSISHCFLECNRSNFFCFLYDSQNLSYLLQSFQFFSTSSTVCFPFFATTTFLKPANYFFDTVSVSMSRIPKVQ